MSWQVILVLMLLGHLVADYTLQGWLADGKQKSWWKKICGGKIPDKYKTADEASKAFTLMCEKMSCHHCPYNQGRAFKCKFTWLYATAEKEETK